MAFVRKSDLITIPTSKDDKDVKVIYIYKETIDDELDQQVLFSTALSYVMEKEDYDVICYRDDIWFGLTSSCKTCIYIGLDSTDFPNPLQLLRFIDKKIWKLSSGFMNMENIYTKIIITSISPPEDIFKTNKKWLEKVKTFEVIKLD